MRVTIVSESKEEWYKAENERLTKQVQQLIKDLHRIDNARQAAVIQASALACENERLSLLLDGGAIGERGHACLAIDGGNL